MHDIFEATRVLTKINLGHCAHSSSLDNLTEKATSHEKRLKLLPGAPIVDHDLSAQIYASVLPRSPAMA
jgi:hypothetical protein